MRVNWRLLVGIVISFAALALILKDVSLPGLMQQLAKGHYVWMIPNAAALLLGMWGRAVRWHILLNRRLPVLRAFNILNAGNLLNNVLPLRLGEFAKVYMASRNSPVTIMQSLSTVLIERLLDVLTVFVMLLLVLPHLPKGGVIVAAAQIAASLALLAIVGLLVAAAFRERTMGMVRSAAARLPARMQEQVVRRFDDFLEGASAARGKALIAAIGWSVVTWIGFGLSCYTSTLAFVPDAPWYVGGFVNCAIVLGLTIPSAPAGAGLYEAAAVAALVVFGVSNETALASALVLHLSTFAIAAVLGVIGLDREGESFKHLAAAASRVAHPGPTR